MLSYVVLLSLLSIVQAITPVILVPGVLGSQLEVKLDKPDSEYIYCANQADWFLTWLSLEYFLGPGLNCWADNFRLNFTNGVFKDRDGVQMRPRYFGELDGVKHIDNFNMLGYYNELAKTILAIPGAIEGLNVRAAPFDFRYSPPSLQTEQYFIRLKLLIEETYLLNHKKRVVVIAHSLGCLMMSTFLNKMTTHWKDTYVDSFISIAGVYAGALKLVKAMVSHGVVDNLPDFISDRFVHRRVARTIMSNFWMLPQQPFWDNETLLSTPRRSYTVRDYPDLFKDMGYPQGGAMWEAVQNSSSVLDTGVKTFCFNGKNIDTTASYYYTEQSYFPDYIPLERNGFGDGTVPARSLEVCHGWKSTEGVFEYPGEEAKHLEILSHPGLMNKIKEYLISGIMGKQG